MLGCCGPRLTTISSVVSGACVVSLIRLDQAGDCLHLVQFYWWDLNIGNATSSLEILKRLQEKGKIRNLGA